ncbi:PRC-barrel domain containing protein [Hyalangium sp.]|uniref:PRC-barrel domain-containing protein n=1 Tax=Hyalangium sp. TaxID=2028555 RepID=UPI002D321460|nr:PRC-barrel domain containing protein [Hyalangium sp.]HYH95409.1 PRC-barrel domain containing protein [Hyalangium sp.]
MYQRTNIQRGMAVMSFDGVQMGRVIDVTSEGITIEKGPFFLRDYRVPFSDISTVRGDEIILMKDHAALRHSDSEKHEGTANGTVGIAGYAAPPPGEGLGLGPTDLTEARMDSAKFQDHGRYYLQPTGGSTPVADEAERPSEETRPLITDPEAQYFPLPHEPPRGERRAAGPGWDPLSVDEEQEKEAPRTGGPDTKPPTRY